MTASEEVQSELSTASTSAGCPYLGVQVDPQTRVGWPDQSNYCHLVKPPKPVLLPHQTNYCLSEIYEDCMVYRALKKRAYSDRTTGSKTPQVNGGKAWLRSTQAWMRNTMQNLHKPESNPVSEDQPVDEQNDGAELWTRLHSEAEKRYEEMTPRERKPWWLAILVVALLVLLASIWGAYNKFAQLDRDSQAAAATARVAAVVTAAQKTVAAEAARAGTATAIVATAQDRIVNQAATNTALAAQLTQAALSQPTPQATVTSTPTQLLPTAVLPVSCGDVSSYTFELLSGPALAPEPGTYYIQGGKQPSPEAAWVIRNTSSCNWIQMALLSQSSGRLFTPVLRRDGQYVTPVASGGQSILGAGEQIEIVLTFRPSNTLSIRSEWVLVVNGFALSNQPHFLIDVNEWIRSVTATPTQGKKPGRPSATPVPTEKPVTRPTETPPKRP